MNEPDFFAQLAGSIWIIFLALGGLCLLGAAAVGMLKARDMWERHRRPNFIPQRPSGRARLIQELNELHRAEVDLEYENSTTTPAQEIHDLFNLDVSTLRTFGQVKRWERVHDNAQLRLRKISGLLNARRELHLLEATDQVPDYLRPPGDAA